MKYINYIAIAFILLLNNCNGQTEKKQSDVNNLDTPKTDIKVNKEYDKNGNLIRYDSTYVSYYSNIKNNSKLGDSIFQNFKKHFNKKYFFSSEPYFNDFFFLDSLMKYDFYKNDFFLKRFKMNMERMDKLFKQMDSTKNIFFKKHIQDSKSKSSKIID